MNIGMLRVVTVGRLVWEKGYERLINVHARLIKEGNIHTLTIIGEGILREQLEGCIRMLQVEKTCKLLGALENPLPYVAQADVFVCSSISEGLSGAVVEAMYLNKPIVATECMGPSELLENGRYGVLVENTEQGLYNGLKQLLENEELRKMYSQQLSQTKVFKFDDQIVKKEFEKLFVPRNERGKVKLLFIMMNMLLGGAEKVLAHLLEIIDYSQYEVELVVLANSKYPSIYLDERAKVRFVFESEEAFWSIYRDGKLDLELSEAYDYVIGFLGIIGPLIFKIYNEVKSIKNAIKVNWVHGEFIHSVYGYDKDYVQELYKQIDAIVCVSQNLTQTVIDYLGENYRSKINVIFNPYNHTYIRYRAKENVELNLNDLYKVELTDSSSWDEKINQTMNELNRYKKIIFLVFDFTATPYNMYLNQLVNHLNRTKGMATIKPVISHPEEMKNTSLEGYLYPNIRKMWESIEQGIDIKLDEYDCIVAYGGFLTVWLSVKAQSDGDRISWGHEDYISAHKGYSDEVVTMIYDQINKIICNTEADKITYIKGLGKVCETKIEVISG